MDSCLGGKRMFAACLVDVFDLLNVRDLDLIAQAAARASRLVVGVCSDEYAERVLGHRPVVPEQERMALVGHVRGVDEVAIVEGEIEMEAATGRVFVAEDRPLLHGPHTSTLSPRRHTRSALLQNALRAELNEAVA